MSFVIFTVLAFLVLRLSTRLRMRTILWLAVVLGLAADAGVDLVVMLQR